MIQLGGKFLPAVLYGRETWSLKLKEKPWNRVFQNRMLRRIFEIKKDEMIESWR
jgi:ribosomal protein L25 (general stress protein Ctc)